MGPETPGTGEILTLSGCKFDYDDDGHHRCYDCLLPATLRAVMSSATSTQGSVLPSLGMRARASGADSDARRLKVSEMPVDVEHKSHQVQLHLVPCRRLSSTNFLRESYSAVMKSVTNTRSIVTNTRKPVGILKASRLSPKRNPYTTHLQ